MEVEGFSDDETVYASVVSLIPGEDAFDSLWAIDTVSPPRLVALQGETVPPNFDASAVITRSAFNGDETNFVNTFTVANNRQATLFNPAGVNEVLLTGNARIDQPYESFDAPGANHLGFITATNLDAAPGLPSGLVFTNIERPRMHNAGTVWFVGEAGDISGTVNASSGLWRTDPGGTPTQVFTFDDAFTIAGSARMVRDITDYSVNNVGDLLIRVDLELGRALMFKSGSE